MQQSKNINPFLNKILKNVPVRDFSAEEIVDGILAGDKKMLGKAITITESTLEKDNLKSIAILEKILPYTGNSYRIGITGVPGVGKSTFINSFGKFLAEQGYKIAILAIDPSSNISKGSILGDKSRMGDLSGYENIFIRPTPNSGILGGVAAKTRETVLLCEAAGYDIIIVETVGVGQSETRVASMTDIFLLLMVAGTGDELQGIKRGIMEMTDILIFTKDDGQNKIKTKVAKKQFQNALKLFPAKSSGWTVPVLSVSAIQNTGIDNVWQNITKYFSLTKQNGFFEENRKKQRVEWFYEAMDFILKNEFFKSMKNEIKQTEQLIKNNKIYPYAAARLLMKKLFSSQQAPLV